MGKEGAFSDFRVIIGLFCCGTMDYVFSDTAGKELKKRGFNYDIVYNITEFTQQIMNYDIAWILPYKNFANEE